MQFTINIPDAMAADLIQALRDQTRAPATLSDLEVIQQVVQGIILPIYSNARQRQATAAANETLRVAQEAATLQLENAKHARSDAETTARTQAAADVLQVSVT